MDELDRGLVAVRDGDYIFVAWRRTGFDESDIRFNLYRSDNDGSSWQQIETNRYLTNFRDPNGTLNSLYRVAKVVNGNSCPVEFNVAPTAVWASNRMDICIRDFRQADPAQGWRYVPYSAMAVDLTGNGQLDLVFQWKGTSEL